MINMTRNTNDYELTAAEMAGASRLFARLSFDSHELEAFLFGFAAALGRLKDPEEPKGWTDEGGADHCPMPVTGPGNDPCCTASTAAPVPAPSPFPAPILDSSRTTAVNNALQIGGHNGVVDLLKAADKIRDYITGHSNPLADEVKRLEEVAEQSRQAAMELSAVNKGRRQKVIAVLNPFVLEWRKSQGRMSPDDFDKTHVAIELKHCEAANKLCNVLTAVDTGFGQE